MKKLLPPHLFILSVISMGILCWLGEFTHYILYPYNLIGLPLILTGIILAQYSKNIFRRNNTTVNTFDKPINIITTGIYKYSRNPMYLGMAIALAGFALLYQGSISSFVIFVLFLLISDYWYIRYEEKQMANTFGEEYTKYCKFTRRWI